MFRVLALGFLMGWAAQAFSAVVYEGFSYAADSRFSLSLSIDNQPVVLKGSLRYGDKVTVSQGLVSVELKSYRQESSVVSAIVTVDGKDMASLFLIDDSNNLHLLNKNPILERRASMSQTLEKIIAKLKDPKFKGWSTAQTFAWLKDMSDRTPDKQLFQYYDKLELEPVTLPKPGGPGAVNAPPRTSQGTPPPISPREPEHAQGENPDEARRRAWDIARRAQWERQHRRGQDSRYVPPPYGYRNGYPPPPPTPDMYGGGYGYPPPPQGNYRSPNPPPGGYGRQPYGYGSPPPQYGRGYPPPPPAQRGIFQNLFGNEGEPGAPGN